MTDIVHRLQDDIKQSLKKGDKPRLEVLRLVLAAVKQKQIDSKQELDDAGFVSIVQKMIKQRRESIRYFDDAKRTDLAAKERLEISQLEHFLPAMMSDDDINKAVTTAIAKTGAQTLKDMGGVMNALKPTLAGVADMGTVSALVRARLQKTQE